MASEELCWLPLERLAPRIAAREVSPVEAAEATLARIERLDPRLNAYQRVLAESALTEARTAEAEIQAGRYRGPLHGVPVALKDLFATRGVVTTGGSRILADWTPDHDAAVVERLRAAGAVIVGKTTLHEFALGGTSINPHYGPVRNPWDIERVPGGSSGGSAVAVAAGLATLALGSETGNSIRRPAAFCGVVGLKPTYGRVSRHGVLPAAWSLDHIGPFARSVRGAAMALDALSGPDARDRASAPARPPVGELRGRARGLRLGVLEGYFAGEIGLEAGAVWEQALATLTGLGLAARTVAAPAIQWTAVVSSTIMLAEAATYHGAWLDSRPHDYGADVRERLVIGRALTAADYLAAQRARQVIADEVARALRDVDALIAPTSLTPATPIAEGAAALGDRPYTVGPHFFNLWRLFSLLGLPVVSVPCGFTRSGLPLAIQIAGRPFEERTVLEIAAAYEDATDWMTRRPPLDQVVAGE